MENKNCWKKFNIWKIKSLNSIQRWNVVEKEAILSNFFFCHVFNFIQIDYTCIFFWADFSYLCLEVFKVVCCRFVVCTRLSYLFSFKRRNLWKETSTQSVSWIKMDSALMMKSQIRLCGCADWFGSTLVALTLSLI